MSNSIITLLNNLLLPVKVIDIFKKVIIPRVANDVAERRTLQVKA